MGTAIGIAIAGALGALARYAVDGWISGRTGGFPWGTFVVNVTGAFLLGFLFTVLTERVRMSPALRTSITVGFLGAYTTFSTWMFESARLAEDGELQQATLNVAGSLALGLVIAAAGYGVGSLW